MPVTSSDYPTIKSEVTRDPASFGYPAWAADVPTALVVAHLLIDKPIVVVSPAPQIPKPMVVATMLGKLSATGQSYLLGLAPSDLEPIADRLRNQDREGVKTWGMIQMLGGKISTEDHAAIVAEVDATIDDPNPLPVYGGNRLSVILSRPEGSISAQQIIDAMV